MKRLKKLTKEDIEGIEYAVLSVAMETGATEQEVNEAKENLKKVHTGEWTDEDYRAHVIKKHDLHVGDLKNSIAKKPSTSKKVKSFDR